MEIDKKIIKKLIDVLEDLKKSIGGSKDLIQAENSIEEEIIDEKKTI